MRSRRRAAAVYDDLEWKNEMSEPGWRDLTKGPIFVTLLLFSFPTLGSSILQSLNGSVNAIWIGRILGPEALTATANAHLIMFFLLSTAFGFGISSTILVGLALGRGDVDGARQVVGTAAFWFFFLSMSVSLLGWIFAPELLQLLDTPDEARPMAISYMRAIFIAMPFMFYLNFMMMALRGAGDAVTPLIFMVISVVIDVVLNPILILGLGPFPKLGIIGSGVATLIAQGAAMIGLIIYIYRADLSIRLRGPELAYFIPEWTLTKSIVTKGFPMGLQMFVVSISAVVMIGFVNSYGIFTAAAYAVAAQLWSYIQMPAMALGASASAMAAQNIGAERWDRVESITRTGVVANIFLTGLFILGIFFVERYVLVLFLGPESPAIEIAQHINMIVSGSFILFGAVLVLFGTVRATGAVVQPLIIITFSMIVVRIGFVLLFEGSWGVEAIWWSYPVSSGVSMLLAWAYYRFGDWRESSMVAGDPRLIEHDTQIPYETTADVPQPGWKSIN